MVEHSPAPWHVTENTVIRRMQSRVGHTCECCGYTRHELEAGEEATVYSVGCYKGEIGKGINAVGTALAQHIQLEADARLIASAPKYHELLKESRQLLYELGEAFREDGLLRNAEDCERLVLKITEALSEVGGGTNDIRKGGF